MNNDELKSVTFLAPLELTMFSLKMTSYAIKKLNNKHEENRDCHQRKQCACKEAVRCQIDIKFMINCQNQTKHGRRHSRLDKSDSMIQSCYAKKSQDCKPY